MLTHLHTQTAAALRYHQIAGEGPPIVALHGLGCASSFEYPTVFAQPPLKGRSALLIDLMGYGFSDRPEQFDYTTTAHAEAVVELIETLHLREVVLYGHSMGGAIAIEVASRLRTKVTHLILSEANLDAGGGEFSTGIAQQPLNEYLAHGHRAAKDGAMAQGYGDWAAMMRCALPRAVHAGATSLVAGVTPDWCSQLYNHLSKRSFIFGEDSLPDPDESRLREAGLQIEIVPGAGHGMALDNPAGLAQAIANCL